MKLSQAREQSALPMLAGVHHAAIGLLDDGVVLDGRLGCHEERCTGRGTTSPDVSLPSA